ncbi:antibiotic biosynthesis monooxygenase [Peribacillus muralis]|uniref:antibiotic biosynthesis monooxygenase family protein n=1 Tax=Peribacillus muralis TaxID=264697 RepID=UPI001F4D8894|nr:antibiotic biosynthesis monooxygenase [Peribacillus muralis]MCK1992918.1 antibiotic biosynthesis monooxygenase [Peribacillus muralis]MCK2013473.1 antibiotic biosynthesis monooxygenase [Peribacillus muralis]
MNVFITSGTYEFMKNKKDKHPNENILLMQNLESAVLLHETTGKTLFSSPRKYEVVDGKGNLQNHGYVVMNNIPVSEEGQPVFEHRFKNRAGLIENEPGFVALRILRPLNSETYVILTIWEKQADFMKSDSFQKAQDSGAKAAVTNSSQKLFSGEAYVTQYTLVQDSEE